MCSKFDCIPWQTPEDALLWPPFLESSFSRPVQVYRKIDGWYNVVAVAVADDVAIALDALEFDLATDDNK